jgi:septum formation protein
MINARLQEFRIILASQSPRRQYLLNDLGLNFEVIIPDVKEEYADGLTPVQIAVHLAELKARAFDLTGVDPKTVIITADTIVSLGDEILGKPSGPAEAAGMLNKLSGRMHEVITAVCLRSAKKMHTFHVLSSVYFKELSSEEISYYIENFRPFDKAGSYGVQEWIGYIGISKIEGSYFNVMGLPVKELYEELLRFCLNNS